MTGGRWSILIVDDEPDLRQLITLAMQFEDDGIEVVASVPDGPSAIAAAAEADRLDLVVLDQHLSGGMSGLDVAAVLRRSHPATKLVLFTAADPPAGADAEAIGIDAVVAKPDLVLLPQIVLGLMGALTM